MGIGFPTSRGSNAFKNSLPSLANSSKVRCLKQLKIFVKYLRKDLHCRDEASLLQLISTYWNDDVHECQVLRTERDYLLHELVQLRRELLEADDHLTKLVFQAARQANTQVQRESQTMDIIQLGILQRCTSMFLKGSNSSLQPLG